MYTIAFFANLAVLALVEAHCKITYATGDLGGAGVALGIGLNNHSPQSDATSFEEPLLPLGFTRGHGVINSEETLSKSEEISGSSLLPQISAGGVVSMTVRQIDEDGAGPMRCEVDASGTGGMFRAMEVTINVPGQNGKSESVEQDHQLEAVLSSTTECGGTIAIHERLCLVRCMNPSGYGGTVVVQQALPVERSQLELRDISEEQPAQKEGKQGNKAKSRRSKHGNRKRRQGNKTRAANRSAERAVADQTTRKEGKQGNKIRRFSDVAKRRSEIGDIVREEGKQGNKARDIGVDASKRSEAQDIPRKEGKQGNKVRRLR